MRHCRTAPRRRARPRLAPRSPGAAGRRPPRRPGRGAGEIRDAAKLLIHRRVGVEKQRDEILDLLLGQRAGKPEPRHLRAEVIRLGVIDLAVDVTLDLLAVAAQLAELPQARAEGAEGRLLRRKLVAVVAAAAGCVARLVGPLQAAAVLRDALAALPVAHQAAAWKDDALHLVRLERLREP